MRKNVALVLKAWERDSGLSGRSIRTHGGTVWSYNTPILTRLACVADPLSGEWYGYDCPHNDGRVYLNVRHYSQTTTRQQDSIALYLRKNGYRSTLNPDSRR